MSGQPKAVQSARDGASQVKRINPCLLPNYALVDERSLADLIAFAKDYAKALRYFAPDNQPAGDWSGFLDRDIKEIAAYLENPAALLADPDKRDWYLRPHFVLFVTFLRLLSHARDELNGFTRRHLEFYFRQALGMAEKSSVPDRVHVLVDLAAGEDQHLLPKGTLLAAGQDTLGLDLSYATLRDIVINRAQVAALKSLYVQKRQVGLREVRESVDVQRGLPIFKSLENLSGPDEKPFLCMLSLALGEPTPGGALPTYSSQSNLPPLGNLDELLRFIQNGLGLNLPAFRTLMQLRQKLNPQQDARWNAVNGILRDAGKSRKGDFPGNFNKPDDFEGNLLAALGMTAWGTFFDTLPEVDNVYDLYRLRDRADVRAFIVESNALFMSFDNFVAMMGTVGDIHKDWRKVYDILRAAGKKINSGKVVQSAVSLWNYDPVKFDTLVGKTLGQPQFPKLDKIKTDGFDACYQEILNLEAYFHLSAENYDAIRRIVAKQNPQSWEWEQVYEVLEKAHNDKEIKDRHGVRDAAGFDAMIRYALGNPNAGDDLPEAKNFLALDADKDATYIREKLFLEPANFGYIQDKQSRERASDLKNRPTAEEWAKAYNMLSLAQIRKRGPLRVQVDTWDKVLLSERDADLEKSAASSWRIFGGAEAKPAGTGFAIASPLLALAEGKRTIRLTLTFKDDALDEKAWQSALAGPLPFSLWLSTGKQLEQLPSDLATVSFTLTPPSPLPAPQGGISPARLLATIVLSPQFPAVEPLATGESIQTSWPVLRMIVNDIPEKNDAVHRAFAALRLESVDLSVEVDGIAALTAQNDDATLNVKQPFEPFGFSPIAGSSFYVAHPELCSKKLNSLTVAIDWLGVPDNLSAYYQGYLGFEKPVDSPASPIADNKYFIASLRLYDNRALFDVGDLQLFNAKVDDPKAGARATSINKFNLTSARSLQAVYSGYGPISPPLEPEDTETLQWERYWQLELKSNDFMHALYPRAATGYANRKNADGTPNPFVVNSPYTPKIKRLTIGYSATAEIDPSQSGMGANGALFHLEPFGYRGLENDDQRYWLPQYSNEGELFIGVADLDPPKTLSLLFQIAEGSADPDVAREPVHWWYLNGNRWTSLEAQGRVLADGTGGLLNSGVIEFDLPSADVNTLLPSELYWIRASIAKNSRCLGDIVAVCAQAVEAVFDDQNNAPDHLDHPLPAGAISQLAEPTPEIKGVRQPFSSAGGLKAEQPDLFYTRVSERLRHKHRALTAWDYERLVLERFPGIYKVKCIPVGSSADPRFSGQVKIIVVPDIRGKLPFDPFGPKVSADKLAEIQGYLRQLVSPMVSFTVANPQYVRLRVRLGVRLSAAGNPGFYRQALIQTLIRYLAPWAFDESQEIVFGGRINANLIVNFIERLEYVDYVADPKLFISTDDQQEPVQVSPQYLVAPEFILVPEKEHDIDLITGEVYEDAFFTGINYMKVGLDFAVA